MITVVLDTNVIIRMFGRTSGLAALLNAFLYGKMAVAVSPAIWLEYHEVCVELGGTGHWSKIEQLFDQVGRLHDTILRVNPAFRFGTITQDPDDNAFADCAITAHADFVITEDRHFRPLSNAGYKAQPMTPQEFMDRYL